MKGEGTESFFLRLDKQAATAYGILRLVSGMNAVAMNTMSMMSTTARGFSSSSSFDEPVVHQQNEWMVPWMMGETPVAAKTTRKLSSSASATKSMVSLTNDGTPFQIFVKSLSGKTLALDCHSGSTTTIHQIKEMVHHKEGVPLIQQRLIVHGKEFADTTRLVDCQLGAGEPTFQLALRILGGDRDYQTWVENALRKSEKNFRDSIVPALKNAIEMHGKDGIMLFKTKKHKMYGQMKNLKNEFKLRFEEYFSNASQTPDMLMKRWCWRVRLKQLDEIDFVMPWILDHVKRALNASENELDVDGAFQEWLDMPPPPEYRAIISTYIEEYLPTPASALAAVSNTDNSMDQEEEDDEEDSDAEMDVDASKKKPASTTRHQRRSKNTKKLSRELAGILGSDTETESESESEKKVKLPSKDKSLNMRRSSSRRNNKRKLPLRTSPVVDTDGDTSTPKTSNRRLSSRSRKKPKFYDPAEETKTTDEEMSKTKFNKKMQDHYEEELVQDLQEEIHTLTKITQQQSKAILILCEAQGAVSDAELIQIKSLLCPEDEKEEQPKAKDVDESPPGRRAPTKDQDKDPSLNEKGNVSNKESLDIAAEPSPPSKGKKSSEESGPVSSTDEMMDKDESHSMESDGNDSGAGQEGSNENKNAGKQGNDGSLSDTTNHAITDEEPGKEEMEDGSTTSSETKNADTAPDAEPGKKKEDDGEVPDKEEKEDGSLSSETTKTVVTTADEDSEKEPMENENLSGTTDETVTEEEATKNSTSVVQTVDPDKIGGGAMDGKQDDREEVAGAAESSVPCSTTTVI